MLSSSDNQPQNVPVSQSESPTPEASEVEPVHSSNPNLIALGDLVCTFADNTWLRSSAVKGVDYNKLDLLSDGVSLQVQDVYGEWERGLCGGRFRDASLSICSIDRQNNFDAAFKPENGKVSSCSGQSFGVS